MSEIEWLDADGRVIVAPPPDAPRDPGAARTGRFAVRSVAQWVEIGWLVSAGLAVLAPFLQLYRLRVERANVQSVDGWGRYDVAVNAAEGSGAHGIRFGIVSVVAAGVILVALALRRRWPTRNWSRAVATTAGALAAGLLVATSAAIFLDSQALLDSIRSELSRFTVQSGGSDLRAGSPRQLGPTLHVGAGSWTMVAAAVVGLVLVVVDASRRRGAAADVPAVSGNPVAELPLDPGDERL